MAKTLEQFLEVYRPKSADEQRFVDKHVTVKNQDRNGNGDDVFQAKNIKTIDRKKERKGYNPGEDEKVYEELKGNQHKIDANKNGKVDAHDFKLLRSKKKIAEGMDKVVDNGHTPIGRATQHAAKLISSHTKRKHYFDGGDLVDHETDKTVVHNAASKPIHVVKKLAKDYHAGVKEEAEQIDELSKNTLRSYVDKRATQRDLTSHDIVRKNIAAASGVKPRNKPESAASTRSYHRAINKIVKDKDSPDRPKVLATEEAEQIDELSKKTLGSYAKKAKDQMSRSDTISGREMGSRYGGQRPSPMERKHNQRADKRYRGLDMAISKLAKEEVELEEAMSSYDRYTSTHGDAVKLLKSINDHLAAHKKAAISHSSPYDKKKGPHWGHVGDIDSIHRRLKDIHDQLAQQGEYSKMHEEIEDLEELDEAGYSAKDARSGKDIGKRGKQFASIAKKAAEKYGSKESGKKVAGAILAKLRREDVEEYFGSITTEANASLLLSVFNELNEQNQFKLLDMCESDEGLDQALDFSIRVSRELRGE